MKDIIKAIILPAVLGIVGTYFTYTYNQARLKADYARTVHDYLDEIQSDNIAVSQVALEILRPILNSRQEEAIIKVIKANQKRIIDRAATAGEDVSMSLDEVAGLNPDDADDLTRYTTATALRNEALESLVAGDYEQAAEKLKISGKTHPDFVKSVNFARLVEDSLIDRPLGADREIEVLNSIAAQRMNIPARERQKIAERSQALSAKRKAIHRGRIQD